MYYEINVAKEGRHYFATDKRSLKDVTAAQNAYNDFRNRFPKEEGFSISISYNPQVEYGQTSDFETGYQNQLNK